MLNPCAHCFCKRPACVCVSFYFSCRMMSDVRWFSESLNIKLKALRKKVIFWRDEKAPLSFAFIRFGRGSIGSVWHSSAPLCIVKLFLRGRDAGIILVRRYPCALCWQVNWIEFAFIIQITWVKTKTARDVKAASGFWWNVSITEVVESIIASCCQKLSAVGNES